MTKAGSLISFVSISSVWVLLGLTRGKYCYFGWFLDDFPPNYSCCWLPCKDDSNSFRFRLSASRIYPHKERRETKTREDVAADILTVAYVGSREANISILDSATGRLHPVTNQTIPVGGNLNLPPVNGARAWDIKDGRLFFIGTTDQTTFLYTFNLLTQRLTASSTALELLPWTLGFDSRLPGYLWCFAVEPFGAVRAPLSLYLLEVSTGRMKLVDDFEERYCKSVSTSRDNYCGAYDSGSCRFFIFLDADDNIKKKKKRNEDEGSEVADDEYKRRKKRKKRDLWKEDPVLLIVDTNTFQTSVVRICFAELMLMTSVKLNQLESFVYSPTWDCLFGFAACTNKKKNHQRLRMQFVRIDVATGEVTLLGKQWKSHQRAEDGLMVLDDERGLLYTSVVNELSWFTTHWRFVTIDVRTGEVANETSWYNASSRTICFFPPALLQPVNENHS